MTVYSLSSEQNNTMYLKFTGSFPTEYPVGTGFKIFAPNQFYLPTALCTDAASTASIVKYVTSGVLIKVVADSTAVIAATTPVDSATVSFSYTGSPYTFTMAGGATGVLPTGTTGAVVSYSIDKNLPNGLTLNTSTGLIGGTPTGATGTVAANYTVTALNSDKEASTAVVNITVTGNNTPNVSYAGTPYNFSAAAGATGILPTGSTGIVGAYSISHATGRNLPTALLLNPTTGLISGTPTGATGPHTYTITTVNSAGYHATTTISVQVSA